MSTWLTIPSKRPIEEADKCLVKWHEQGYLIALWLDEGAPIPANCDMFMTAASLFNDGVGADRVRRAGQRKYAKYPGYAVAVNELAAAIMGPGGLDPKCDWIVAAGDDMEPDANHTAQDIAQQCSDHFRELHIERTGETVNVHPTFGIMQPTGDRYGEDARSIGRYGPDRAAYADRVCGSAWIGREACLRLNKGQGPLYPGFSHMYVDECLQMIAEKLGILWQRRDLIHYHNHWARPRGNVADMPEFLREVNSPEHWRESKALFDRLDAEDFAECMPL